MAGVGQRKPPARFTPTYDPVPIMYEAGWAPGSFWDGCGKSRPPPGFEPRTVQPVASGSNDNAIPAHINTAVEPITFTPNCIQYRSFPQNISRRRRYMITHSSLISWGPLCLTHRSPAAKGTPLDVKLTTLLEPTVLFLSITNWPVYKPKALASRDGQYQHCLSRGGEKWSDVG